ncbi:MAG: DPP IV N-terminal domain-containing protein, partial [Bacteroidales bacterium]|nr:DPP IV N-terminal domain-containing protein [Bacteroidales bacterium]
MKRASSTVSYLLDRQTFPMTVQSRKNRFSSRDMKKYLFILCAALSGSALFAQSRIIDIHPAASPEGKILSMEDVITNRNIYPENLYCTWKDSGTFMYYKNGKWEEKTVVEVPPEPERWSALNRGNSLYITKGVDTLEVAFSNNREIVFGQSVSRNEFGINEGVYFSPSGNKLAFFRKDESLVTDFP